MATVVTGNLTTSLSSPPDATQTYFRKVLMERAMYKDNYGKWADDVPIPQGEGKIIIMRRYAHLAQAISALTEGVPPSGKTPSLTDYQATLAQYGDFIAISDLARWTQKDPVLNHWTGLLGEQAGYSTDSLDRDTATAGTGVTYTNGTARTDVVSVVDGNDLDRVYRTLVANGAQRMVSGTAGTGNEGMYPTMPAYPGVTHPFVSFTLQNITGFRWPSEYKGGAEGEVGRYKGLCFYESADPSSLSAGGKYFASGGGSSTTVKNTSGTVDVYTIMFFGKHGMTKVGLNGKNTTYHVKGVGTSGVYDPLDQVGTTGWKSISARLRTNENWLHRLECAAEL